MTYKAIVERGETSWGAYIPDLPGCIAVGQSRAQVEDLIREAASAHVELLRERGEKVPAPSTVAVIDVYAA
jgi:predicted RNase H-like HicB family nuclease